MSYFQVIWHLCSRIMEYKVEQLQKRALCFLLFDSAKSYPKGLVVANKNAQVLYRLQKMANIIVKVFIISIQCILIICIK